MKLNKQKFLLSLAKVIAVGILVAAGKSVIDGGGTGKEKTITILHTNDTHSQIFPIAADKGRWAGFGGYAKRAYLIDGIRAEGHGVLLFDSAISARVRRTSISSRATSRWTRWG